jgi:tetratricopeptide (TPR) repeat protein
VSLSPDLADAALENARRLAATAQDEAARAAYLRLVQQDPTCLPALLEFGTLVGSSGHRSAARSLFTQAIHSWPNDPRAHVALGNLLCQDKAFDAAHGHFDAALVLSPSLPQAHQGIARCLAAMGRMDEAGRHRRAGFANHAVSRRAFRGYGPAIPLLLLVATQDGNLPTTRLIDDTVFAVTALACDAIDRAHPLPPHQLVLNAIGDVDLCRQALSGAAALLARTRAPVINPPHRVAATGRAANARRLATIPGVVTARTVTLLRQDTTPPLPFPFLLRSPGYHAGTHFLLVETAAQFAAARRALPGDTTLAIQQLPTRGGDGLVRKYRVMSIAGRLYPLHLAISEHWKVHYLSSRMAQDATLRAEEARFLQDMPGVLRARAMAALSRIALVLGLDYAGIDFTLAPDGTVLLFEANATMGIHPPDADPIWDYRRAPIAQALAAAQTMLLAAATS